MVNPNGPLSNGVNLAGAEARGCGEEGARQGLWGAVGPVVHNIVEVPRRIPLQIEDVGGLCSGRRRRF